MSGNTVDISAHRFKFWEPVWYFEPTAKFPEDQWKPARFVGFAPNVGDPFTYKVGLWTQAMVQTHGMMARSSFAML